MSGERNKGLTRKIRNWLLDISDSQTWLHVGTEGKLYKLLTLRSHPEGFWCNWSGRGERGGGQPCIEIFKNSPDDLNVHVAKFDNHTMFFESESRSVVSHSLRPPGLYSPWNSPGQNTGVGSLSLFQGIFPTQGSNPGLPQCSLGGSKFA